MPIIDWDRYFWNRTVTHLRGLAGEVLALFDAQAARFARRAAEGDDIRRREIQSARLEVEQGTRAVIATYLAELDVNDGIVRRSHGPGLHRVTAHDIWTSLYVLVDQVEKGRGDGLSEFQRPVATAMLWWLHPLPDPQEWHWPRGLPPPRPAPGPPALPLPEPEVPPAPAAPPVEIREPIISVAQPPPTPRWGPGVLRIEGTVYVREAHGGALIGTRDGEASRPDLLRRLTDVRPWFPAARWRDGEDGEHQGWFVPGSTAVKRVSAWLDAGARGAPKPDRPPRKPRPTRAEALAAWRAERARQREAAQTRAVRRWTAERAEVEAAAAARRRAVNLPPAGGPEPFGIISHVTDMSPLWLGQIHTPAHLLLAVAEAAAVLRRRQEAGHASRYREAGYVLIQHVPEGTWSDTGYHVVPARHSNGYPDLRTLEGARMGEAVSLERAAQILEWAAWHHDYVIRYARAFCEFADAVTDTASSPSRSIVASTAQIMRSLE